MRLRVIVAIPGDRWRDVLEEGDALRRDCLGLSRSLDETYEDVTLPQLREDAAGYAA